MTDTRTIKRPAKPRPARITSAADVVSEKEFMANVKELARFFGWRVFHNFDARRSDPGFPDLICVRNGRLIAMELKREDHTRAKQTPDQALWLVDLNAVLGVKAYLFRPSDMPRIRELLA